MSRRFSPTSTATSTSRRAGKSRASFSAAARPRSSASARSRRSSTASPRGSRSAGCRDHDGGEPGTIEHGRFAGYARAGINRVSLGAQSFDAAALAMLGRIHGPGEIDAAVSELDAAGLDNFNLDLMYALPHQTRDGALADLEAALALGPAHLSRYQLTLEPGTVFHNRPPPLPDDELAFDMQQDGDAASRLRASRSTRSPPMRGPGGNAGTTSITGASATTSASAPARTARRGRAAPSSAPKSRARPAPTLRAAAASARSGARCPQPSCPSSSC